MGSNLARCWALSSFYLLSNASTVQWCTTTDISRTKWKPSCEPLAQSVLPRFQHPLLSFHRSLSVKVSIDLSLGSECIIALVYNPFAAAVGSWDLELPTFQSEDTQFWATRKLRAPFLSLFWVYLYSYSQPCIRQETDHLMPTPLMIKKTFLPSKRPSLLKSQY